MHIFTYEGNCHCTLHTVYITFNHKTKGIMDIGKRYTHHFNSHSY